MTQITVSLAEQVRAFMGWQGKKQTSHRTLRKRHRYPTLRLALIPRPGAMQAHSWWESRKGVALTSFLSSSESRAGG